MKRPHLHLTRFSGKALRLAVLPAVAIACTAAGYAVASTSKSNVIHGCVQARTHLLEIKPRCIKGTQPLTWNTQGPAGPAAEQSFAEALPGGQVIIQHLSHLQANPNGAYVFWLAETAAYHPSGCVVTATPVQSSGFAPTSADTVSESVELNKGVPFQWLFQVYNSAGKAVSDGIAVTASCPST